METLRSLWSRLVATLFRDRDEQRLAEEIDLHLSLETDALVRRGLAPEAARREAHRRLGGRVAVEEGWRDAQRLPWLDALRQDVRYGLRGLRRDPRFTVLALLTLAGGIGATTAIFGLLRGVVLDPLPYREPGRLVRVYESSPSFPAFPVSPWSYLAYRREGRSLEDIAVYTREDLQLAIDDRPERLRGLLVSASYFTVLGVPPALGHAFSASDEHEQADVVIISDALWRRRFAADPSIVGRALRLSGRTFTVIGVMPPGFEHVGGAYRSPPQGDTVDAWWPVPLEKAHDHRQWHYLNAVARLKPGVTPAQAAGDLDRVSAALVKDLDGARWIVRAQPLSDDVVGTSRDGIVLLMGAVALVMIIACANVSSLLLARATARRRERAVRFALGATRSRLVRQALTESAVLMVPAAVLGAAVAWAGTRALHAWLPSDFPRLHNVRVDAGVLVFCAGLSALAVVVFGLVPSWRGREDRGAEGLHDGGARTSGGRQTTRLRQALVICEIALASALLVAGGLLVQSFVRLQRATPGFVAEHAVTALVALPEARYPEREQGRRFVDTLVRELRTLPGVTAAGAATDIPWTGYDENTGFGVVGAPKDAAEPNGRFHAATPGFFRAAGMTLVAGRFIDDTDTATSPPVVVVNEALARKYLPGGPAVGRVLEIWDAKCTVVGVVGDVRDQPADAEAVPAFWWPHAQSPRPEMTIVVRTAGTDPVALVPDLRRVVRRLDPQLPLAEIRTLEDVADAANAQRRFLLAVTLLFAGVALALSALGAYGVLSWTVRQRTRELGIRMALGADRQSILREVMTDGVRLAVVGLAAGLVLALFGGRVLAGLLYGMSPRDAGTFAAAAALMLVMSALAAFGPALAATRTSPVEALRAE